VKDGKIKLHGQCRAARIDLECPLTKAYLKAPSNPGKATGATPKQVKQKPTRKKDARPQPKQSATQKKDIESTPEASPQEPSITPAHPLPQGEPLDEPVSNAEQVEGYLSDQALKRLKLEEEHEKLKLKNRATRGELIERELVQLYAHKEDEIDNGQWKTLGLKISSDVAAMLGIDDDALVRKVCDLIDKEVLSVLKLVKRERNKFLKKIGAEKIPKERAA
jgi:hypothetical protein